MSYETTSKVSRAAPAFGLGSRGAHGSPGKRLAGSEGQPAAAHGSGGRPGGQRMDGAALGQCLDRAALRAYAALRGLWTIGPLWGLGVKNGKSWWILLGSKGKPWHLYKLEVLHSFAWSFGVWWFYMILLNISDHWDKWGLGEMTRTAIGKFCSHESVKLEKYHSGCVGCFRTCFCNDQGTVRL